MKYLDALELNKVEIIERLEELLIKHKVEPVGDGYIDCIIMKNNLEEFIINVSNLGILAPYASWWCYVDPSDSDNSCPHGMGGPQSIYYDGWFSELQNDLFSLDEQLIDEAMLSFDKQLVYSLNLKTFDGIKKMLEIPFKYTPNDYIKENKCVNPGLWLIVPDEWKRQV